MSKGQWPVQRYTITLFLFAGVDKYANHIISFVSKRTTQRSRTAWFTCVHTKYNILRPMFVVYSRELYNSRLPVQIQQIVYNSMRLCAQRGTLLSGRNHQWPSTACGPSKFHIHIIYTTTPLFAEQQTTSQSIGRVSDAKLFVPPPRPRPVGPYLIESTRACTCTCEACIFHMFA